MQTIKMMPTLTGNFIDYLEDFERSSGFDMAFLYLLEENAYQPFDLNYISEQSCKYPIKETVAYNAFVDWLKNKFPELKSCDEVLVWSGY